MMLKMNNDAWCSVLKRFVDAAANAAEDDDDKINAQISVLKMDGWMVVKKTFSERY